MKKLLSILLVLVLMAGMALPVQAQTQEVCPQCEAWHLPGGCADSACPNFSNPLRRWLFALLCRRILPDRTLA
ncbi:MAG: hypothetical protein FWE40_06930 [Oscillospiraceae bacterium]|nr:hypothetical protein [Oscillospiraceae bacterium]